jgi:hypothetical protein
MTTEPLCRGDLVKVRSTHGHGPTFRYLKQDERDTRIVWLEVSFTGRVFRFPLVLLRRAEQ